MKQILWIGCLESEEEFKIKAQKGYDLASAQVSQQNILNGIEQESGVVIDSINGSVLPHYPIYSDRIIKPVVWSHVDGASDISVGYKNVKYINRLNSRKAMIKVAQEWIENRYKGGELKVLVYSMRSAPMATALYIKKVIPTAKIYLIVTDLPQFMDLGQSKLKAILKKVDWLSIKKMQKHFDGFILYASNMAEYLGIPEGKWLLMEGSYDSKEMTNMDIEDPKEHKKAIMYSGKLDTQYGIDMLLDAFMGIPDEDIELWLTGGGNSEKYIRKCAESDIRIKYYGFLPSRADVIRMQKKASVLINMRLPSEDASNYSFPSKLFEYMATGIPVLTFKLGGIPEEYYEYMTLISEESVGAIKESINTVFKMTEKERNELGVSAQGFVLGKKTLSRQSERIFEWISRGNVDE